MENIEFRTRILFGKQLKQFSMPVSRYRNRSCYKDIAKYLYGDTDGKVLILYGLHRTGKTTLIRQSLLDMTQEDFNRAAIVQVTHKQLNM